MIQHGDGERLAVEALAELRCPGGENFDRRGTVKPCVAGFVDLAHLARTKGGLDFRTARGNCQL